VGTHLTRHLSSLGHQVFAVDRTGFAWSKEQTSLAECLCGDIRDSGAMTRILAEARPDTVYHLAGVLKSEEAMDFYAVHVLGTVSLFESIVKAGLQPVTLVSSSSAVYRCERNNRRITERFKLEPISHYAVSKLAQESVAARYVQSHGLPVVCARTFNLLGPGQSPELACSAFARQIARAERSRAPGPIRTGRLTARRDFTDVRDAVRAYELLSRLGRSGCTYNVCTGKGVSIQRCLDQLVGMSERPVQTEIDPDRIQSYDVPAQIGSAERLRRATGWKPRIPLKDSLRDLLAYWRDTANASPEESAT